MVGGGGGGGGGGDGGGGGGGPNSTGTLFSISQRRTMRLDINANSSTRTPGFRSYITPPALSSGIEVRFGKSGTCIPLYPTTPTPPLTPFHPVLVRRKEKLVFFVRLRKRKMISRAVFREADCGEGCARVSQGTVAPSRLVKVKHLDALRN